MNTIPLIFNERQVRRTVLGGAVSASGDSVPEAAGKKRRFPLAVMLLSRGGNHYRQQNINNLIQSGFDEILSIESSSQSYSLEEFAQRYPAVKFIVPLEEVSPGDMINIGIAETEASHVLIIWDDIKISSNFLSAVLADKLAQSEALCTVPFLQSAELQYLPIQMSPNIQKSSFTALPGTALADGVKTLYPFDFIGVYNRQKFMQLGGFDYTITSPHWQNLDFALRAWLWGEEITLSSQLRLIYEKSVPPEDTTADYAQLRFFLKNCAPVFSFDHAYIPKISFLSFARQYSASPFAALKLFKDGRNWVRANRFRFKTDITRLAAEWNEEARQVQ